jgi:hypothetical protein
MCCQSFNRSPLSATMVKEQRDRMRLGGPFENSDGGIVGTLFIIDAESRATAMAFTENEPFHKAGVFESVVVRRWRQMQPEVSPGANEGSAVEAELQLGEEGQRAAPLRPAQR